MTSLAESLAGLEQFIFFIILASAGGYIGHKLRLPIGNVIGAMFAVGLAKAFHVLTFGPSVAMTFTIQIVLGLMLGLTFIQFKKEIITRLTFGLVVITVGIVVTLLGIGFLLVKMTDLHLYESILAAAPGGLVEMATIADALAVQAPVVVVLHLVRVIAALSVFPVLASILYQRYRKKYVYANTRNDDNDNQIDSTSDSTSNSISESTSDHLVDTKNNKRDNQKKRTFLFVMWCLIIILALVGGYIGFLTRFPIGALLGALLFVGGVQVISKKLPLMPIKSKRIIQVFIGGGIGLSFTADTFVVLKTLLLPALIITILQFILAIMMTYVLHKWLNFDLLTALCSTAPAGVNEMVITAERFNANVPLVATIHLYRVVVIITTIPFIFYFI